MDKKGQLNLELVKSVLITVLILGITAITLFLVIVPLLSTESAIEVQNGVIANNTKLATLFNSTSNLSIVSALNCKILSVYVINSSTGYSISAGNYTFDGCNIVATAAVTSNPLVNNTLINVTGTYTYDNTYATDIVNNVTGGTTNFFTYVPTVFTVLGVAILIGFVALIIYAISRFSGGQTSISDL